ncbi:MAG: transcriptional repressor [Candidatus Omnitrophota bacterium]
MQKEQQIFNDFLKAKGLKFTGQRGQILKIFLETKEHLSVEDLYGIVKKKNPAIGQATVFRTLKLLSGAGIAREINLGDRRARFEYDYKHHDHLICQSCLKLIETVDSEIERLQDALCKKFNFTLTSHKLQLFGICKECKTKLAKAKHT